MSTGCFPSLVPLPEREAFRATDPQIITMNDAARTEAAFRHVGQEEAVAALQLVAALGPGRGHAFVVGRPGHGRHAITRQVLEAAARRRPTPVELLYVVRFTEPLRPRLLRLPAGVGQRLAAALRQWTQRLGLEAKALLTEGHEQPVKGQEQPAERLVAFAKRQLQPLREAFVTYPEVVQFLDEVVGDLAAGDALWLTVTQEGEQLSWSLETESLRRYEAHLLVARQEGSGAPVVEASSVTQAQLFGWIESEVRDGERITHHQLIRPGCLAQADGGFLLIDAQALVDDPAGAAALLRALRHQLAPIEPPPERDPWGAFPLLTPDPIPIAVQVVVIGTPEQYQLLVERDERFTYFFPVVVPFAETMARTLENEQRYATLLAQLAGERELLPPSPAALAAVLEEAARAAPDRGQLSLAVRRWVDLLAEADVWARQEQAAVIERAAVERALAHRFDRSGSEWRQIMRAIRQGELLIACDGGRIGQVNGLVVFDVGEITYGHPVRITATVRLGGEGELIDIERESGLGGAIHSKGVLILAAFLAGRFARQRPLPLAASLVMEQSYAFVEGDSASLAEACALLSAIAQVPLAQGIAVTGSINQLGEVQPVGAVNEKIEGWFATCAALGLTGRQGVIVPLANRAQLMLRGEVRRALAEGTFHLWAVADVESALALLTGRPRSGPQSAIAAVTRALARLSRWHDRLEEGWHRPWQRRREK